MRPEDSFKTKIAEVAAANGNAAQLYSKENRFGVRDWETVGLCLTAPVDVSVMNAWRPLRPVRTYLLRGMYASSKSLNLTLFLGLFMT